MSMNLSHQLAVENFWEDFQAAMKEESLTLANAVALEAEQKGYFALAEEMKKEIENDIAQDAWRMVMGDRN